MLEATLRNPGWIVSAVPVALAVVIGGCSSEGMIKGPATRTRSCGASCTSGDADEGGSLQSTDGGTNRGDAGQDRGDGGTGTIYDTGTEPPPPPAGAFSLTVRETSGVARQDEVVRSGVPLPRAIEVTDANVLAVLGPSGTLVAAEFKVLSRRGGARDGTGPIEWLLVSFPATVAANGTATYQLVYDGSAGSNPAPSNPLTLTQNGSRITIDTGVARFVLGGDANQLFDEILIAGQTRVAGGGSLEGRVQATSTSHASVRRTVVEHAGPLSAVVVIEGAYDLPANSGGGIGSRRRYVFTAGSPAAIVSHSVSWEGDRCGQGTLECTGAPNALRVESLRDSIAVDLVSARTVTAIGDFEAAELSAGLAAGGAASVRQKLRAARVDARAFEVVVSGQAAAGTDADGALLSLSGNTAAGVTGAIAIALNHMHNYEPQALRVLADGRVAIDIADGSIWLGARQGMFATFAVGAFSGTPSRAALNQRVFAPLNAPLRAWPSASTFRSSGSVGEIPVGTLPGALAGYDEAVRRALDRTVSYRDQLGLQGLMTFGLYPRYWGTALNGDEISCTDPTPGESWDELYWCATFTDYHNTISTAPLFAMRTGEVKWLDDVAFPAALRTLHTQIIQCAPGDTNFYCGQAPAGYGGYRADFNSSHGYFENLMLYYWLTGDYTVVETLKRGAEQMRRFLCSRRPASACEATDVNADYWAQISGRVASQWFSVFRFIGLASDDAGFLEDFRSGLARAVTQVYVEPTQNGQKYGFWLSAGDAVDGPGTDSSDQLWMGSLYDMNNLWKLKQDTQDAPIGSPALPPSRVVISWARSLATFAATVVGNGTVQSQWPNAMTFTWSGSRIGGTLGSVSAAPGSEPLLYDTSKSTLAGVLVRTAVETNDASVRALAQQLTEFAIERSIADGAPLGKVEGEYLNQLHFAVGLLANPAL